MSEKLEKCKNCGKEVPAHNLSFREKECGACRAADRASDMTVGDLGSR